MWLFLNNIFFFTFLSICFYFLRKPAENPRYNTLKIRKLIGNFKEATTMLHDSQEEKALTPSGLNFSGVEYFRT